MFEQEHPIPQQISAYEFHLVGDMTLKQFFQVAGGALISLVLYGSSLPVYVKWPLILASFLAGVAFAFLPIQDRPLSTWIFLFIKAIYSPTTYIWRKTAEDKQTFQPENANYQATTAVQVNGDLTLPAKVSLPKPSVNETPPIPTPQPTLKEDVKVSAQAPIPTQTPPTIEYTNKPQPQTAIPVIPQQDDSAATIIKPTKTGSISGAKQAQFSSDAAPPTPPNIPNVIVGQVMDPLGKIVEAAILEVKDSEERPVRALKTNKLGHFMIVTPLQNGNYQIVTEKDGLVFEPVNFEATGDIIQPIAIWAKSQDQHVQENITIQR